MSLSVELQPIENSPITLSHTLVLNGQKWVFSKEIEQPDQDLSPHVRDAKIKQLQSGWAEFIKENGALILESLDQDFLSKHTTFYVKMTDGSVDVYTNPKAQQAEKSLSRNTPLFQTLQKTNNFSTSYLIGQAQQIALQARLIGLKNPNIRCFIHVAFQAIAHNPTLQKSVAPDSPCSHALARYQRQLEANNPTPINFENFIDELQLELNNPKNPAPINLREEGDPRTILAFLFGGKVPMFELFGDREISSLKLNGTPETLFLFSDKEKPLTFSKNNATYTLQSFGVHSGSADKGHHILYLRKEDGTCWCLNDEAIYQVTEDTFRAQAKNGTFFNYNREELGLVNPAPEPVPESDDAAPVDEQVPLLSSDQVNIKTDRRYKGPYLWKHLESALAREYIEQQESKGKTVQSINLHSTEFRGRVWTARILSIIGLFGILFTLWDCLAYLGIKISEHIRSKKQTKKIKENKEETKEKIEEILTVVTDYCTTLGPGPKKIQVKTNLKTSTVEFDLAKFKKSLSAIRNADTAADLKTAKELIEEWQRIKTHNPDLSSETVGSFKK